MRKTLLFLFMLLFPVLTFAQTGLLVDHNDEKVNTEVRVGTNGQNYSDGRSSQVGFVDVYQRLNSKFIGEATVQGGQYFGSDFSGAGGSIIYTGIANSYIQVGGIRNTHTDRTAVFGAFIEAGTLLYGSKFDCRTNPKGAMVPYRTGFIKAIELDYNQTWQGFGIAPVNTDVHTFNPRLIFYLPKGVDFMLRGGVVDIIQNGLHNPTPLGGARIRVPVTRRLGLTASAGFDSEGITNVAQLLSFSTRNYGAGASYWLTRTTSIEGEGFTSLYTANHLSGNTYRLVLRKRF